MVRICREVFGQGDDFVHKITGSPSVDRPLQKIREFRNRPNPRVVVTVDMLSTGVDIPSLEFVVFMRPVKSRILWVQMLGRGTRLCPEIHKTHFIIFDCFNGTLIDYFRNATDFDVEPPRREPLPVQQIIENIYQNVDRDYHVRVLVKRFRRIDRRHERRGPREIRRLFIDDGDIGKFAGELPAKIKSSFVATMKILERQGFPGPSRQLPPCKEELPQGLRGGGRSRLRGHDPPRQRLPKTKRLPRCFRAVCARKPGADRGYSYSAGAAARLEA